MSRSLEAAAADLAEVERIVRASGTSFYRGMRILPPDRRAAMYGIYAFCRIVDDIADEPAPIAQKHRELALWRQRIADLARNQADEPVSRVLLAAKSRFGLLEKDFLAVIDGMQSDADQVIVAPSDAELDVYCDRVASAVGRLSVRAFGEASEAGDEVAYHLGRALQLTNILRDVAEDAGRGRIYISREILDASGVAPDPQTLLRSPGLPVACSQMAQRAHGHFDKAFAAMRSCDPHAMRPARAMAEGYYLILAALEKRGWDKPDQPAKVPKWKKLLIALRYSVG